MKFYEVAPASRTFHGSSTLTYCSDSDLNPGQLVVVKIRSKTVVAFIYKKVPKPEFKTVPIQDILPLNIPSQHLELFKWLTEYYPAPIGAIAQLFLPFGNPKDYKLNEPASAPKKPTKSALSPPPLTTEQEDAVKVISENKVSLLHGDTGTGKTRVYIDLAQKTLESGKSVLVLVPEISLSPQIVKTFQDHFDTPLNVTHSNMTPLQRRKVWQSIAIESSPQIVIGPRSALFTPLNNIGLIVIDEFHEAAYKQDQSPYYQTLRVAGQFARLHNAKFIMGSATPLVSEYFVAEQKHIPVIRMTTKAIQNKESSVDTKIVNLRDEVERTRYPLIGKTLIESIKSTLEGGEQILLFLNKRGSARLILCQNCGWHALCPNCDLPLTYHGDSFRLQCHTCGFSQAAPTICPVCTSADVIFKSPGTKAIVDAISHHFPEARVARFDRDNKKAERLEARHSEIVSGEIDILVGTQLLAKGHDLPRLALVGILLAENELQFPDYTSSERSFQLMHQLIGRVGRGHRNGAVVVQTHDPSNLAVQTAVRQHSWKDFYDSQINERKMFTFPPFAFLMKIEVSRGRQSTVLAACDQIIDFIRQSGEPIQIIGPAPSFIEKQGKTFNWQIIVKSKQRSSLTHLAKTIPVKCTINLDPSNLL